jgi:hypothetical protein
MNKTFVWSYPLHLQGRRFGGAPFCYHFLNVL